MLTAASDVLEECDPGTYTPLDLSGVTIVQCEGDGGILRYGKFFRALGKKTYAFYDKQANAEIAGDIDELFDGCWELDQTGIEYLLAEEVAISALREFLEDASASDDYPSNSAKPSLYEYTAELEDDEVRKLAKRVLRARKGSGYAGRLVEHCEPDHLPVVVVAALQAISEALPDDLLPEEEEGDEEDDDGADSPGEA
ncbi:hypothetical protein ABIE65_004574 [Constrictibacter sp. MBR-5]|uniref:hypothetical protein n=1 Tax=Constrictibacter sp. MBR-5 TaxID=3156467 RepID=UPI0033947ABE